MLNPHSDVSDYVTTVLTSFCDIGSSLNGMEKTAIEANSRTAAKIGQRPCMKKWCFLINLKTRVSGRTLSKSVKKYSHLPQLIKEKKYDEF